ncbi:hypothetical protein EYF80_019185 [Liparis tanakae]|uniref:Uncharacterized protein n=1 Tax=Liparis tanakae TaxID=230148 RepID=A0A4Z2HYE9_9TELE|nr:hypothetical protein EYF80_019185 [Liparis tanakae]
MTLCLVPHEEIRREGGSRGGGEKGRQRMVERQRGTLDSTASLIVSTVRIQEHLIGVRVQAIDSQDLKLIPQHPQGHQRERL